MGGNFIYIIKCKDESLYTGWTNDLEARIQAHNEGRGAKYTKGRGPVELLYIEEFDTKEEAMKREFELKKLSKEKKLKLIQQEGVLK